MLLNRGLRSLAKFLSDCWLFRGSRKRKIVRRDPLKLGVENLESRQLLTAFVVTTAQDDSTVDSVTSLREAIALANANAGADTITFDSSLAGQHINLFQSQLEITDPVTITGLGALNTVIDAQRRSRVFNIQSTAGDVTLEDMTITGGLTQVNDASGAGIRYQANGTLSLIDTTVTVNATTGLNSQGAGIASGAGDVFLFNSTVSGNSTSGANAPGGGIATGSGDITLINSTISSNATGNNNSGGGGISTFNGNIRLTNATVAFNLTSGTSSPGGGIQSNGTGGASATNIIAINNSIVAKNSSSSSTSEDISKSTGTTSVTVNGSLVGVNTGSGLTAAPLGSPDVNGNLIGVDATPIDPKLDVLATNGGTTKTHALLLTSPAIDGGINALAVDEVGDALLFDQAGQARIFHGTVDMGAFELQQVAPVPTVSFALASQTAGEAAGVFQLTVNLSAATTKNVSVPFTLSGTAINGFDYTIVSSPLTIPAGATSASIAVTIKDDTAVDGNKTLIVTLGTPTNATLGSTKVDTLTITDNDNGAPTDITLTPSNVAENATNVVVGTLAAIDPNVGDTATFSIQAGGQGSFFTISGNQLKVGATGLDFESLPGGVATVTVRATDSTGLFLDKQLSVNVTDVNEAPSITAGQTFSVLEGSPVATVVGTVAATDPDKTAPNNTLTYTILSGNTSSAFALNSSTGQITVANAAAMNATTNPSFTLQVKVTDGGSPGLSSTQNVTITVADANSAPSITAGQVFTTAENRANGAIIGTVQATDPDTTAPNKTLTYSILSGNTNNAFAINSATGQITVATPSAVNFEQTSQFVLTVEVTDGGTPALSATANVTINVTDVNENPSIPAGQIFAVNQGAAVGTSVGTVSANDPDTTAPNKTLTYSITSGNSNNAFVINSNTGEITVNNPAALNPAAIPQFTLVVKVTDGGTPGLTATQTVTVNVSAANQAPTIPAGQAFSVPENSALNTVVGIVAASDPDTTAPNKTLTYSITGGNTGGAFAINSATGQLTVANPSALNFEATPQFTLTIQVADGGSPSLTASQNVTVNVTDVNEVPTVTAGQVLSVNEHAANFTVVGTVAATDPDTTAPNKTLTFSILSGNTSGAFAINPSTGQITVSNSGTLSFNVASSFSLQVKATDGGNPALSSTQTVTVNLVDVNETPTINAGQVFTISDNVPANFVVGTVVASDPDATAPNKTLTYSIVGGNTGNTFTINSTTGQLTVLTPGSLNSTTTPQYSLQIQVADGGTPSLTATRVVTVNVTAPNRAPVIAAQSFAIPENSGLNTIVGTVSATDPDTVAPNNTLTYMIVGGNTNNAFTINFSTGEISVLSPAALDFETTPVINLVVRVSDGGLPVMFDTETIPIQLTNVNEAPAIAANQSFSVNESSPNATVVGTVAASDPDLTAPFGTLTYSITGGNANNAFAINAATGQLTVNNSAALVFANGAVYSLQVQVADGGVPSLMATQTVTVRLVDVNEPPTITLGQIFNVDENSIAGTSVGTVDAHDPDATSPNNLLTYSIVGGNTNSAFSINPATGEIKVNNPAVLNFEAVQQFILQIQVVDGGSQQFSDTENVEIDLNDVDEPPVIAPGQSFSIPEQSPVNTVVGTVQATDFDTTPPNETLSYHIISGNIGGAFAIDPLTGVITVADSTPLDAAVNPQIILQIEVADGGSPTSNTTADIPITIADVNAGPSIPSGQTFSIAENQPSGSVVGTVSATDPDPTAPNNTLTYSIIGGNGANVFAIDSSTGQLLINDPTALNFESTQQFILQIQIDDGGTPSLSATNSVTINVTDVNEGPSVPSGQSFTIAENSAVNSAVGSVTATDPDTTAPDNTLTYSITGGNTQNAFAIDAATGQLTVNNSAAVDFETNSVFSLQVTVTDGGGLSAVQTVTVNLTDVNETPSIPTGQSFSVDEHAADGTVVGTVSASDSDLSAPNDTLTFGIDSGNTDGAFAIDPATGEITVANSAALDFSNGSSFTLQVRVTDAGVPNLSVAQAVTVNLNDVNSAPTISVGQVFHVNENPTNGQSVGTVAASDADPTSPNNTLTYSIVGGNTGGAFAINSSTGEITVANASAINFEVNPQFNLQIKVVDGGTPSLSFTGGVTVAVGDVNEAPSIPLNQVFTVAEDAAVNTVLGTVSATDPDTSSPNNVLTFSIASGNSDGTFAIDPATGAISINSTAALDFETTPSYTLAVMVTDGGGLSVTQNVTVNVTNTNDAPVLGNSGADPVFIAKNHGPIAVLPNVTVNDIDSTTDLAQIVISLPIPAGKKNPDKLTLNGVAALGSVTEIITGGRHQFVISLNAGVTNAQVQSFLRSITFTTKGKGLKLPQRDVQVQVMDRHGGTSNVITQNVVVRRK